MMDMATPRVALEASPWKGDPTRSPAKPVLR